MTQPTMRLQTPQAWNHEQPQEKALRPRSFEEWIGQADLMRNLKTFVHAARERQESLDHILLCGPPGLGKTSLAHLLAQEMNAQLHITSGPALEKRDLAGLVSHLKENDVLFIDECHRLNKTVEEHLYPAMEDYVFELFLGEGPHARAVQMPLPRFTLVAATTRLGLLTGPMRDRFGFIGRLTYYNDDDLMKILQRSATLLNIPYEPAGLKELAQRSRGTPRIANRLLRRIRDFAEIEGNHTIDYALAHHALARLGVDHKGLDEMDRNFLSALIQKFAGGPVGLNTLAAVLSEEPETVAEVLEPYLLQEGLIARTPRGRVATPQAYRYLNLPMPHHLS